MQRKIKEIDKYKKRIQLVNKVIKKLMQHMILLVKYIHPKNFDPIKINYILLKAL